ncbi:MAG: hypothetical protein NTV87_15335 [Ignavibacteriae bacterium]|nr:hypothetical protein [Ignavibacteriota bacterium]
MLDIIPCLSGGALEVRREQAAQKQNRRTNDIPPVPPNTIKKLNTK